MPGALCVSHSFLVTTPCSAHYLLRLSDEEPPGLVKLSDFPKVMRLESGGAGFQMGP